MASVSPPSPSSSFSHHRRASLHANPAPSRLTVPAVSFTVGLHSSASSPPTSPLPSPPLLPIAIRPPMSRSHSQSASISSKAFSTSRSLPPGSVSPYALTPQSSTLNVTGPRRLLIPTVRHSRPSHPASLPSPKASIHKSPQSRLSRSRASSVAPGVHQTSDTIPGHAVDDWIGGGCKFDVVQDNIIMEGYQLYAVEKWVVDRTRPIPVLAVFTGDPRHRITATALSPSNTLSLPEAAAEWDKALSHLRQDGARPKETERGVIMVTSLANFRSDYTIVHIPKGNFLDVRDQLYTNINILRMGCAGRSALTLEEPSDTTKERFISMYHLSDKALARSQTVFNPTVIELIKLIQASLAICGMYTLTYDERHGLLCDMTLEGIQKWVEDIGRPLLDLEPLERAVDPAVVAALFSTILTVRNKLQALGYAVPKDPFLDPCSFLKAVYTFQSSSKPGHGHSLSLSYHPTHSTPIPPSSTSLLSSFASPLPAASTTTLGSGIEVYLTHTVIQAIQTAYDKLKQNDSYKVHRVLINKLDDLATDLRASESKSKSGGWFGQGSSSNSFNNNQPLADLAGFVKCMTAGTQGKEAAPSLRYLWTGRPEEVGRKRKEKDVADEGELDGDGKADKDKEKDWDKDRDKEKDKDSHVKERMSYDREVKSSEDEGELSFMNKPWSGRVQRKIEVWAALGRAKKLSADFGAKGRALISPESPPRATQSAVQSTTQLLPSVVISRDPADEDDVLNSGQASPTSDGQPRNSSMLGLGVYTQRSASQLEYDRRVIEFDARRAPTKAQYQTRIISWSDPVTARGLLDEDGDSPPGARQKQRAASRLRDDDDFDSGAGGSGTGTLVDEENIDNGWGSTHIHAYHRQRTILLKKRRSFDDAERLRGTIRVLHVERMRIDVELCGQLLIMRRREEHLANVVSCLQALTRTLSTTNAELRNDYNEKQDILAQVEERTAVLQGIEGMRIKSDAMTQETQALAYESAQFLVEELWHMASQPRQKVLELREKVFGTGTKRSKAGGARGPFNRVQTMLDGSEVLVDELGRTQSEAEEEERLGVAGPAGRLDEEETGGESEEEGEEGVDHPNLRPTWVLRMFNYWGSRWGTRTRGVGHSQTAKLTAENGDHAETSSASVGQDISNGFPDKVNDALSTSVETLKDAASRRTNAFKAHTT